MLIKNEFPAIPIIEQIHITSMHSLFKIHYEADKRRFGKNGGHL